MATSFPGLGQGRLSPQQAQLVQQYQNLFPVAPQAAPQQVAPTQPVAKPRTLGPVPTAPDVAALHQIMQANPASPIAQAMQAKGGPEAFSPEERQQIIAMFDDGGPGALAAANDPGQVPIPSPEEKGAILSQFTGGPNVPQEPTPQAPQQDPGFLQQMAARQDAPALYEGLIQGGVGMLGAKNIKEGLAQGAGGFSAGYDAKVDKTKAERRPKIVPLAGGAFSLAVYPDGTQKVIKNSEIAQYNQDIEVGKFANAMEKLRYGSILNQDNAKAKQDGIEANKARDLLGNTDDQLQKMDDALALIDTQGTMSQVAGIPGVSTVAGFMGLDDVAKNKFLTGIKVDETLLNTAKTKGAISNQEMNLFKEPIPSLTDDREKVWKPFLQKRKEQLAILKARLQEVVDRGDTPNDVPVYKSSKHRFAGFQEQAEDAPQAPVAAPQAAPAAQAAPQVGPQAVQAPVAPPVAPQAAPTAPKQYKVPGLSEKALKYLQ